jgi:hypothetical protein
MKMECSTFTTEMNTMNLYLTMQRAILLSFVGVALSCLPTVAAGQGDSAAGIDLPQQYSATAVGQAGAAAGKTFGVTIYLTGMTSDQEEQEFAATLKSKGQDGLVSALEKAKDVGRVSPVGGVGSGFRIARAQKTADGGWHIALATNRPISFGELYDSSRSREYPIGIVTLNVDKDGNGSGLLCGLCKLKFNKKGELQIEHYGQKPFRLTNVRRQK